MAIALVAAPSPAYPQHQHGAPADTAGVFIPRMGSGTTWLPDAASQPGYHTTIAGWSLMAHGSVFVQYVRESGTRAAHQLGSTNWLMAEATRPVGGGGLHFRVMGSAEPWTVTGRGYPQLLQVAQPYRGTTVTDHQHPHELLMEAAALYELGLGAEVGMSLYFAPVGEPALGPVAFSHRPSAAYEPTAPLGHHIQDFTHTTFGVMTAGLVTRRAKIEGSIFNGDHPDDVRTNFDPIRLNSVATRLSVNPSAQWSIATWLGHLAATAGAHSHGAAYRFGASVSRAKVLESGGQWATTFLYAADVPAGAPHPLSALLFETALDVGTANAIFGRLEYVRRTSADLALIGSTSRELDIGAISIGYARELPLHSRLSGRLGARGVVNLVPAELELFYGSRRPLGLLLYALVRPPSPP